MLYLSQECGVLMTILLANITFARTQILVALIRITQVPGNSVEFMITHNRQRATSIDHGTNDVDRLDLMRASVDKVAHEDGSSLRVSHYPVALDIAKAFQEYSQLICLAVYIPNNVVTHHHPDSRFSFHLAF